MTEPKERVYRDRKRMIIDNFIGGIAWALGSTIGFTVVLIIVGYILSRIDFAPILSGFLEDVIGNALQKQNPLLN